MTAREGKEKEAWKWEGSRAGPGIEAGEKGWFFFYMLFDLLFGKFA